MASNLGNSYVISRCGINHNAVENVLSTITQCGSAEKKAIVKLVQNKSFLTQVRMLAMYLEVHQSELPTNTSECLVKVLSSLSESEQDRKILRTALHVLSKDNNAQLSASFFAYLLDVVSAVKQSSPTAVVAVRILGKLGSKLSPSSAEWSKAVSALQKFSYLLINSKTTKKDPVHTLVAASFSGLRQLKTNLSVDSQQALTQAMQSTELSLQRHILSLLIMTVQTCTVEHRNQWLAWFQYILSQPTTNTIILKDALASTYAVRAIFVFVEVTEEMDTQKRGSFMTKWPSEVIHLLITALNLTTNAQLKYFIEYIQGFVRFGWRLLPHMETKQKGVVGFLCGCLASVVKKATPQDLSFPTLLRACEQVGKFLQQRPNFDAQHSHPAFSPHMIELDGEALKALWIALRRQYRACIAPKSHSSALPSVWKTMSSSQQLIIMSNELDISQLAPDSENSVKVAASIPSPYLFACLIRTLIWLAPDLRYCRREHPILWKLFSDDLLSSWEVIASLTASESQLGDPMVLITDLLTHFFARVQLSTMILDVHHDDIGDANVEEGDEIVFKNKCKLIFEPLYIDLLCSLTTATLRQVISPPAIALLPQIYTSFYAFAHHTAVVGNGVYVVDKLRELLLEVMTVASEAQSSKNVFKRQLYQGVTADAVLFLIPASALALKLHYQQNTNNSNISANDPLAQALQSTNLENVLHQTRVVSVSTPDPARYLSIQCARLIIALSEVFATVHDITATTQIIEFQRRLSQEICALMIKTNNPSTGLNEVLAVFSSYSLERQIMSTAANYLSSFSSVPMDGVVITNSLHMLGVYNAQMMIFEDIVQTEVFEETVFDERIENILEKKAASAEVLPQIDIIPIDLESSSKKNKEQRTLLPAPPSAVVDATFDNSDLFGDFELLQPTPFPAKPQKGGVVLNATRNDVFDSFGGSGFDSFEAPPTATAAAPADFSVFETFPNVSNAANTTSVNAPATTAITADAFDVFNTTITKPDHATNSVSNSQGAVKTNPLKNLPIPSTHANAKLVALPPPAASTAVGGAAVRRAKGGQGGKPAPPTAKDFLADLLSSPPAAPVSSVTTTVAFGAASSGFGDMNDPFRSSSNAFASTGSFSVSTDPFAGFPPVAAVQPAAITASAGPSSHPYPQPAAPAFTQPIGYPAPPPPMQYFPGASQNTMQWQQQMPPAHPLTSQQQQVQLQQAPQKPTPPQNPFDEFS